MNNLKEIKKKICRDGAAIDMCHEAEKSIKAARDIHAMCEVYRDNHLWCVQHDFPGRELIERGFDELGLSWLATKGERSTHADNEPLLIWLCDAAGTARYTGKHQGRVFLRHDATMYLKAEDYSFVIVSIYDEATLYIEAADTAKVHVFRHGGGNVNIETTNNGNLIIK